MSEPTQRIVETNGIRLNIAEQGEGPVVLCVTAFRNPGFPGAISSMRWPRQVFMRLRPTCAVTARATGRRRFDHYTIFHFVGDMVGVLDALESPTAVIAGHDVGANVAWQAALLRPARFRAVIGLSVPFRPRGKVPPTSVMPRTAEAQFYQLYFQEPGVAEAEFERDPRATVRNMLFGGSGDAPRGGSADAGSNAFMVPRGGDFLRGPAAPATLPVWLSERDVDFYADEFRRTGFRGALNWYRNIDRNWELSAPFVGARVTVPALYLAGDRDLVVAAPGMDQLLANLKNFVPDLRDTRMLPGCGHWTQQERPDEVNAAIIGLLRSLPSCGSRKGSYRSPLATPRCGENGQPDTVFAQSGDPSQGLGQDRAV